MIGFLHLVLLISLCLPLQSQILQGQNNYPVTYRPGMSLSPKFSALQTTTPTPYYPYVYGQNQNNLPVWPYIVDPYNPYQYNNVNYMDSIRPTLQTYPNTTPYPWQLWYQQQQGTYYY